MQLKPYQSEDAAALLALANSVHGAGYLNADSLSEMAKLGLASGLNANFVVFQDATLVGYRLSFAPGNWQPDHWCSTKLWPVPAEQMAYFKSVAVAPAYQGQGIGSRMLRASIEVLKRQGALAGLAHLWMQSPGNSAVRYFSRAGGKLLAVHPDKWLALSRQSAGYDCPVCGEACHCTAAEMVLTFEQYTQVTSRCRLQREIKAL